MSLPYRWHPAGTRWQFDPPEVGMLVPYEHAVWRVVSVQPKREGLDGDYTHAIVLRPVGITGDDPRDRDRDRHVGLRRRGVQVYPDEHYPVCATCAEPLPCREQMAARVAQESAKRMGRYEMPGVCPACQEPVTARQKVHTFPGNTEVIGGPPVTFHLRNKCHSSAVRYEERAVAVDPAHPRFLTCPGHVTTHAPGTYQCTEMIDCPGPQAWHRSYELCRCGDCGQAREELARAGKARWGWTQGVPGQGARRIDSP